MMSIEWIKSMEEADRRRQAHEQRITSRRERRVLVGLCSGAVAGLLLFHCFF